MQAGRPSRYMRVLAVATQATAGVSIVFALSVASLLALSPGIARV